MRGGQIRHPPGSEIVDHTDPLSFRKEEVDGMRSDEPRPTGDEDEGSAGRRCRHETTPRGGAGGRRPRPDPAARVRGATRGRQTEGLLSLAWVPTGCIALAIPPLTALTKPDEGRPITHREEDGLDARIAVDLVVERPQSLGLGVAHSRIRDRPTPEGVVHQK